MLKTVVPAAAISTVETVSLNNPVVASPLRCGLVTEADVPRVIVVAPPVVNVTQLEPLQPSKTLPVHWRIPASVLLQVAEVLPIWKPPRPAAHKRRPRDA